MADGVLLDQAIIAKAAADFDATAKRIQEMMSKMNGDVTNAIGQTRMFNGAARLAFDQNHALLNEKISKATVELNVIGEKFKEVMGQHASFAEQQATRLNQQVGPIHAGLNG